MFELKAIRKLCGGIVSTKLGWKVFVFTLETSLKSGTEVSELCEVGTKPKYRPIYGGQPWQTQIRAGRPTIPILVFMHQPISLYFTPPPCWRFGTNTGGVKYKIFRPPSAAGIWPLRSLFRPFYWCFLLARRRREKIALFAPFLTDFPLKIDHFQRFSDLKSPKFSHPDQTLSDG